MSDLPAWKRNTRGVLFPGSRVLLRGRDLHAIHQLWPRVPFYRYGAVWAEVQSELREKGSAVVGWSRA